MSFGDKANALAKVYFSSFSRYFGETPNFPSSEERESSFKTIELIISEDLEKYGNDPAIMRIIDCDILDKMEELINTYK